MTTSAVSGASARKVTQTTEQANAVRAAETIVDKYWKVSDVEVYQRLLSEDYKNGLAKQQNVKNAHDYQAKKGDHDWSGSWTKFTVQGAWPDEKSNEVEIEELAEWEDEGSDGVSTFYFFVRNTAEGWRITHIFARGYNLA